MPKEKVTANQRLAKFAKELGNGALTSDGSVLHCNVCSRTVMAEKKFQVNQHLQTAKHIKNMQRRIQQRQPLISSAMTSFSAATDQKAQFHYDLTEALLSSDIPLWKLENAMFTNFLSKYIPNFDIPSESTLRKKYVPLLYQKTIQRIRDTIGENNVFIVVDETTDAMNRHLCHFLIGPLSCDRFIPPMLLDSVILESTNSSTISQCINNALVLLWPCSVKYDRVCLLLTDAAPYMIKAGAGLSVLYPKMIHLTCLVHSIHRVSEFIRSSYADVDTLIATVKQLFVKAPSRRRAFLDSTSLNQLPPSPTITRWGTWIEAACFYQENFETVKNFIMGLEEKSMTIQQAKSAIQMPTVNASLVVIRTHFKQLVDAIRQLERRGLRLTHALSIVIATNRALESGGSVTLAASQKMNNVLLRNPGWSRMMSLSQFLSGDSSDLPCSISPHDAGCYNYAPITSVDVERSFSEFKYFFRSNRTSFTQENLKQHLIVLFNNKRFNEETNTHVDISVLA